MRKHKTIKGECYHLFNITNTPEPIFRDDVDRARFLYLIVHLQSSIIFNHLSRPLPYFLEHATFKTSEYTSRAITEARYVELISFTLMPNHFDLVVRETKEGGIPYFMQRVQNAYTKYWNTKYRRRGHLFRGPYHYEIVATKEQLSHLSAHLHLKPRELPEWRGKEEKYPWSSFQDFSKNRWGTLLAHEHITDTFKDEKVYRKFVLHPSQKTRRAILGESHFFT